MADTDEFSDVEILARTIFGECRGEIDEGKEAVACTILNRAAKPRWWGTDVRSCCLKPFQYSCWLPHDPNRHLIVSHEIDDNPVYQRCLEIAERAIGGLLDDCTRGCTHYERIGTNAGWSKGVDPEIIIGHHAFYKVD